MIFGLANMLIAASTYLNSAPLVYSFGNSSRRQQIEQRYSFIGDAAPARCAELLENRECEIALIPVIEYQRIPGLRIIPEIAVASKHRVRSVLLVARRPLDQVNTVALDTSSRTSQTLVKILFSRRYGRLPEFSERTPDAAHLCRNMLESNDAALVIGDPAMRLGASAKDLGLQIYDLADEWRALTGLPFVFAVWAAREEVLESASDLVTHFIAAKLEGIENIEKIAARYAVELNLPYSILVEYLQENVNYDLDDENLAGLQRYFELAEECGLLPSVRELRFA
jgi:chorismate dehydratase